MKLTRGKEIEALCKKIAEEYEGWEYSAKAFKNKELGHTVKTVSFLWTGSSASILAQPIVTLVNKRVEKVWKLTNKGAAWSQFLRVMRPGSEIHPHRIRIKDPEKDNAEGYIREVLDIGIQMLEDNWDFSSEENLLRNLPVDRFPELLKNDMGTRYCIARLLLGDFEYIEKFYNDEIITSGPKRKEDLEKIMAKVPEFKEMYDKKGILYI